MQRRLGMVVPLFVVLWMQAQSTSPALAPEEAFISADQYTNAFFGFAVPVPQLPNAQQFLPKSQAGHTLFGLQSYGHGLSVFLITADGPGSASEEEVKKAAAGAARQPVKSVMIGGKAFWKSEGEQKSSAGKLRSVNYATALRGYVVTFAIAAFDGKVARELERTVESLKFFDPATAKDVAGSNSRPFAARAEPPSGAFVPSKRIGTLDLGKVTNNLYANDDLGFSYEFPAGWQAADRATQAKVQEAGHQALWGNDPAARAEHDLAEKCARTLLYATKYPAGSVPGTPNPAVTIIAFDPACSPGVPPFPTSADNDEGISRVGGVLTQVLQSEGFRPKKQGTVRVLSAQGHLLVEVPGEVSARSTGEQSAVHANVSIVFMELKGYWIGISFIAGDEAGVRDLMGQAKIAFAAPPGAPTVSR